MPPKPARIANGRKPMLVFIVATTAFALAWFFGISWRALLWDVGVESVRRSGITRELRGGAGDMTSVLLILILATVCYAACLWALSKNFRHARWFALGGVLLVGFSALPAMPLTSPDTTHFAADVRTLWLHGRYPTQWDNRPSQVDDPVAKEVRVFADAPSGYGPVSYALGGVAIPFVGDNLRPNVFGIKVVSFLALIATSVIAGLVASSLGRNPAVAIAAIGMNPTFVWHFPGDGHNDVIMSAFGMAAVLFLVRRAWPHRFLGAGLGALSVLSKFSVVLIAPIVLTAWFPKLRLIIGSVVALGGTALIVLYFGVIQGVSGTSGPVEGVTRNTPWYFLFNGMNLDGTGHDVAIAFCYSGAFIMIGFICAAHRFETKQDLVNAMGLAMGLFLFLFAPTLRQWYQIWAFPLLMLCSVNWLRMAGYCFSLAGMVTVLSLNWNVSIERQMGISNPIGTSVVLVWLVTAGVAIVYYLLDRPAGGPQRSRKRSPATDARRKMLRAR